MKDWTELIFTDDITFPDKARKVFDYQYQNNPVYQRFCDALNYRSDRLVNIPLLPIQAFKDAEIITIAEHSRFTIHDLPLTFKSSGTSGMQQSVHPVLDTSLYEQSLLKGFNTFYNLDEAIIWGYTPGYDENPHSSLIYMIQKLIEQDETGLSRFLPLNEPLKPGALAQIKASGKQLILFGAAFGLIDLVERASVQLPKNSIVIETGGMKTHRREMERMQMHRKLAGGFGIDQSRIHSEYGMCELLSQAYATGGKWFRCPPWMQVSVRDADNPFEEAAPFSEGLIGVIDLANVHSCSFILTGDRGIMDHKGRFQVLGRWNPKDLRGCNFLIEED